MPGVPPRAGKNLGSSPGRHPANARGAERKCRADTNRAGTTRLKRTAPLRLTLRRPHDDRPARGVKARRVLRRRTMVAFHNECRVSPTITGESRFRNKIPETLKPGCLCNRMKTLISDHDYELYLGGTAKPGIQKTLDCRGDLRYLCGRPQ